MTSRSPWCCLVAWLVGACAPGPDALVTSTPTPAARADVPTATDDDLIVRALRGRADEVTRCYEAELVDRPDAQGRVVVQFSVEGDALTEVILEENTVGGDRFTECFLASMGRVRLARPAAARARYRYPYVMTPEYDAASSADAATTRAGALPQ